MNIITTTIITTTMKMMTIHIVITNMANVVADIITMKIISTEMNTEFQLLYIIAVDHSTE
jgi:hypothetical protein